MSAIDCISSDADYSSDSIEENWAFEAAYKAAAYLTDPVCKAHEFYRRLAVVDALNPSASKIENFARKFFLVCGMVACTVVATVTTLPGSLFATSPAKSSKSRFSIPEEMVQKKSFLVGFLLSFPGIFVVSAEVTRSPTAESFLGISGLVRLQLRSKRKMPMSSAYTSFSIRLPLLSFGRC